MFPHTLGYFPMVAAWVIIIVHLETAKRDLTYITDRTMPEWVNGAVYGTVIIFWSFSVVSKIELCCTLDRLPIEPGALCNFRYK